MSGPPSNRQRTTYRREFEAFHRSSSVLSARTSEPVGHSNPSTLAAQIPTMRWRLGRCRSRCHLPRQMAPPSDMARSQAVSFTSPWIRYPNILKSAPGVASSRWASRAITLALDGKTVVPASDDDWRDWVSATALRGYLGGETLGDWLDRYGGARAS